MSTGMDLVSAVKRNDFEKVKSILEGGLDANEGYVTGGNVVNTNTITRETPLPRAAALGYYEVAELLIKHGAHVDENDTPFEGDYQYPIIEASKNGHNEIIKLLVKNGADITIKDVKNKTAFDYAVMYKKEDTIELLKNIEKLNNELIEAVKSNNLSNVKSLIEKGASYNAKVKGKTPLKIAKQNKFSDIENFLIEIGAGKKTKSGCFKGCLSFIGFIIILAIIIFLLRLAGIEI